MYEPISNITKKITEENFKEIEKLLDAHQAEYAARPRRKICGVEVTRNGEKTRLFALCDVCEKSDSAAVTKNCGEAGARTCDWCGAVNINE